MGKMPWNEKGKRFFLLDESKGYTYPFSFIFLREIFFDKNTQKSVSDISQEKQRLIPSLDKKTQNDL
jgi:hypothetical protein